MPQSEILQLCRLTENTSVNLNVLDDDALSDLLPHFGANLASYDRSVFPHPLRASTRALT